MRLTKTLLFSILVFAIAAFIIASSQMGRRLFLEAVQSRYGIYPHCESGSQDNIRAMLSPEVAEMMNECPLESYIEFGADGLAYLAKNDSGVPGNKTCPRQPVFSALPLPLTLLASWPGSGNTWSRYIIQQLTGLWTGSVYKDNSMYKDGFLGEKASDLRKTIVVKSHLHSVGNRKPLNADRQILVVRNPFDAIVAEFKRGMLKAGHRKHADIDPKDSRWLKFSENSIPNWKTFMEEALAFNRPQLIVLYEDLKTCLLRELLLIAKFLGTPGITKFSLCCAFQYNTGHNYRNQSRVLSSSLFRNATRDKLNEELQLLSESLATRMPGLASRLLEYRLL